jgi:ABC-type transport system substrate-binding protein
MAAGAAAAAAAIANAVKASGAIVQVEPADFVSLLSRTANPLVVMAPGGWGWFGSNWSCLTSYKGLIFFTRCDTPLTLPPGAELVRAGRIWIPGV